MYCPIPSLRSLGRADKKRNGRHFMNRKIFLKYSITSLIGWQTLRETLAKKTVHQSGTESTLRKHSKPDLFLIGDSISVQYTPYLKQYLQGVVALERKQDDGQAEQNRDVPAGANGGDSGMVLAYLKAKLNDESFHPDYLLLNCGLHDIKRQDDNRPQVSKEDYRGNLLSIMELLEDHRIRLVWIRTTPVIDEIHNNRTSSFKRYATDVEQYNRIADKVCSDHEIPSIDLFGFTNRLGREAFKDHVHYTEPVRKLQAAYIAGAVQTLITL